MVQDDPKYWMMVERYPNLKEEVGGSIPGYEISSPLDINLPLFNYLMCFDVVMSAFCLINNNKFKNSKSINKARTRLGQVGYEPIRSCAHLLDNHDHWYSFDDALDNKDVNALSHSLAWICFGDYVLG